MSTEHNDVAGASPPDIPWQITGNHWISLPCVHPGDGSVHAIGVVSSAMRGAVELASGLEYHRGDGTPIIRPSFSIGGDRVDLSAGRMAWQRVNEWLPAFSVTVGSVVLRGTLFAPCGRTADFPGFVYALSIENRGDAPVRVALELDGIAGVRTHRIRTSRTLDSATVVARGDGVTITGADGRTPLAVAFSADDLTFASDDSSWKASAELEIAPAARVEVALYAAAAPERDGADAMVRRMKTIGWRALAASTREALGALQQSTGSPAADRLVNRHLLFAYFGAAARAIDDARWYLLRSRLPWNSHGLTVRDWDALMWTIPAIQIADTALARELLLRVCELHGYAPGRGVNYIDGTPFDLGFSIDAVAAYPIAVDRFIAVTGDDRIVEDAPIAEALYAAHDDLVACRHPTFPLFRTDVTPSGEAPPHAYTLHANAIVADALDVLKQTLDEKSAEKVESAEVVRAAILRHFAADLEGQRGTLHSAIDLDGASSSEDDSVGSVYWLPLYGLLARDDSTYRRTVRRVTSGAGAGALSAHLARLIGPDSARTLEWLRRASLDSGIAAEEVDAEGKAISNGGDAALSGLFAYSVWYAVTVLGVHAA